MESSEYKEIITTMGELQDGDQVLGTDGKWHDIEILPIHTPENMFKITFCKKISVENKNESIGFIKCSGNHEWTLFDREVALILKTEDIFNNFDVLKNVTVGEVNNNIYIENIEEIEPEPCRCITLKNSEDMLFQIILEHTKEEIENFEVDVIK